MAAFRSSRAIAEGVCFLLVLSSIPAMGADLGSLMNYVPPSANAVMLMDAAALKKSALAERHGWTQKHKAVDAERPLFLPPEADAIVISSQLDPTQDMHQEWELAIVDLQKPMSMESIAKSEGGYTEKIGGTDVVWTPSEAYFVGLAPKTLGVMYPANRQAVSKWFKYAKTSGGGDVSPYLLAAQKKVTARTPVVLAIELKDVFAPHVVRQAVMETKVINAKDPKREDIARILAGIQGVTVTFEIDRETIANFQFDFADSSSPLANFAQPTLLALMDRLNLSFPEAEKWNVKLEGKAAIASSKLPTTSLRRIFSLLEIPSTKFSQVDEETLKQSGADAAVKASVDYFHSVQALIDDLQKTLNSTRDSHATWMERYGRKVDRLPILNVDEELLAWGAAVGETFRAMALASRGAGIRSGVRKSSVYGNYTYSYDANGYYYSRDNESIQGQIALEENAGAKKVRYERWKELEDATAAIRKKMTKKYGKEF